MAQTTNRDYYKILGVTTKTPKRELKKKYRELAKKYHPDSNQGSKDAEDKFKIVSEAYEILSDPKLKIDNKAKLHLIKKLSECSGHLGIAGGQFLDLSFEHKKISKNKIIDMEIKKTGKLFSFCCMAPAIIKKKSSKEINFFEKIGSDIGLLFQIADDLIDYKGNAKNAGKKTNKDKK